MSRRQERSIISVLPVVLIMTLLVLVTGFSSAQTREVATFVIQVSRLAPANTDYGDRFGFSVSISGNTLAVGAYGDDDMGDYAGAVYLFERDEGGPDAWGQVTKLTGGETSFFGESVSLSGDILVVGVRGDAPYGSARVFERDQGGPENWGQVAKLTASDSADGSCFGYSTSTSGDTIVVGDYGDSELGNQSGAAYVFVKPVTGWADMTEENAKLTAWDAVDSHLFGVSVAVHEDTVVVGALEPDWRGSAYVFARPGTGWADMMETAKLTASDSAEGDRFEYVSISGNIIAVGAAGDDDNGEGSGSVYVFEKPETGWTNMTETDKITASDGTEGDQLGTSVSIRGDALLAGAIGDDDQGDMAGSAYLFERDEAEPSHWIEKAKILASDGGWEDEFGRSASIGMDNLVVGAWKDSGGSVYLFREFEPVAWIYLPVVLRSAP